MSKNYLDEVKNAGEDLLSFPLHAIQVRTISLDVPKTFLTGVA